MEQLTIIGHLGADASINETNGRKTVRFSVAVNKGYKDNSGNRVDRTDWVSVFYGGLGLAPYLKKGTMVLAQGEINTRIYKDKQGQNQVGITINADSIRLLSKKEQETNAPSNTQPVQQTEPVTNEFVPAGDGSDDLPF